MANGSFGLSGFPTAPTTTSGAGGGTSNPFTQTEVTLASVNGFSAGDLVYQYNGDYQAIGSTAASSATFPVETQKVTRANAGDTGFQQIFSNRFSKGRKPVATLSNGNIVWAYLKWASGPTYYPYFIITDENNSVVVAETLIEAVTPPNNQTGPSVIALSGGGFVIAWVNSSNNIRYGVYNSTGTVATALQNDTGAVVVNGNYEFDLAPRPVSGGFVFAIMEQSTQIVKHRVYGSTGAATYAWTSNNTLPNIYGWPRVAVRSDDSFVVISMNNSTNTYVYYLWTSTNTAVTNGNFSAVPQSAFGQDVCTLSNDVYILVAGTSTGLFYRTLTGSTLSGTSVRINAGTNTSNGNFVSARPLTNGGWAVVYTLGSNSINDPQQFVTRLVYVNVYNSSGTLLSVTYKGAVANLVGFPYNYIPGSNNENTYFGLTETANYIHVTTDGYSSVSKTMQWSRLNKTGYTPVPFTSAPTSSANTSALATAAYAPSGSTVTSAAFYAASTASVGWINSPITSASVNAASTLVDTDMYRIETTDSTSLSDGKVVLVYSGYLDTPFTYYQKFILFGSNGSQLTLPTIINSSSSSLGLMRVQGLSNGKFVIWANARLYVYSSSGVQLTSVATTYSVDVNRPINMAALSGGRFALVTMDSSNSLVQLFVYDDNLNILSGPTTVTSGNLYPSLVTTLGNNIYVFYASSAGTINRISEYIETGANTWTLSYSSSISQSGKPCAAKANSFNNGSLLFTYWDSSSSVYASQLNVDGNFYSSISVGGMSSLSGNLAQSQFNSGITSNGTVIFAYNPTSVASTQLNIAFAWAGYSGAIDAINITGTYPSDGSRPTISGFQGERIMLAYVNRSPSGARDRMAVAIFNMGTFQGTQPVVANTSVSNPSVALNPSTGYRLIGVATSTAPAGGTGTVVINGSATLDSTYQSIASPGQAFDFSGPVAFGAAGTVIGRNVNLQGNV